MHRVSGVNSVLFWGWTDEGPKAPRRRVWELCPRINLHANLNILVLLGLFAIFDGGRQKYKYCPKYFYWVDRPSPLDQHLWIEWKYIRSCTTNILVIKSMLVILQWGFVFRPGFYPGTFRETSEMGNPPRSFGQVCRSIKNRVIAVIKRTAVIQV